MRAVHPNQALPSFSQQPLPDGSLAICTTLTYVTSNVTATMSTMSSSHGSTTVTTRKFHDGNCVTSVAQGSEEFVSSDAMLDWVDNAVVFSQGVPPNFSDFFAINNKEGDPPSDVNKDGLSVTSVAQGPEASGSSDIMLDWVNNAVVFSQGVPPNFSDFFAINNKEGDPPSDVNKDGNPPSDVNEGR